MDDVQEAVELLEEQNDVTSVRIKNDMPKLVDATREDLISDIQETIEQAVEENSMEPLLGLTSMQEAIVGKPMMSPFHASVAQPKPSTSADASPQPASPSNTADRGGLMADISRKFRFVEEEKKTVEEAAVSASLYMNPATEKIAPHVKITWEPEVAETLLHLEKCSNKNRPFMVGLVGIPGSGKSTSADILAAVLGNERAIVMPMDGFHVPLADLAEFPNPSDAIYRRGAPDTFNPDALHKDLTRIAYGDESSVTIPGFDHAEGDPIPDQHTFDRDQHRIVICEGLYLLHDDHGWDKIKSFFDWTIYIDADVDTCIERLKIRNKCIPGYTPEEIEIRCDEVDRVNAETSRDGAYKYASQIVKSGASN
ncbi:Putative uridine kinase C227.14 [Seminavis robusta]|uniref:Uridine kinase C227.14 n=1 Tax=Seminavis robusta TaxID=568900 RepID=A0A9N8HX17_9STRA|nr:Putative uridine kinase C227.14 [Seminavis robusta]|eukprot:Sro2102_g314600.1 Putative uridine kinase C227.14 (368) ;mRNA; r:3094-4285